MNRLEQKELCEDAARIKKILEKGYYIAEWINIDGKPMYYLVKNGNEPYKGVYLSPKHNKCEIG